ncbi:MAG: hypothetical protein E7488_05775 [Ruminococcaceae bacterium]|nr:hypothetical protein [Oscillospiraceae bacterium]
MTKKFTTKVLGTIACLCFALFALPTTAFATSTATAAPSPTPTATPKPKVEISIGSEYSKVYDGKELSKSDVLALVSDKSGNGVSQFTYKWYDDDGDRMDKNPVNAGEYRLTITVSDKDPVYTGEATVKYIIQPRPLEWDTSNLSAKKPSDGTAEAAKVKGELCISGIIDGDDVFVSFDNIKAADFPNADAQRTKIPLIIENAQLGGEDADNYVLPKLAPEIEASIVKAYITEITFPDNDNKYRAVVEESVYPNETLDGTEFSTTEAIKNALRSKANEEWADKEDVNTVFYTAVLQVYKDGEWVNITAEDNPSDGAAVVLPYPEGTKDNSHEFAVYKMKTQGENAGLIEVWAHTEKVDGLEITLSQGEPIIVAYTPANQLNKGVLLGIGGAAVAVIAAMIFFRLLKKDREDMAEEVAALPEHTEEK